VQAAAQCPPEARIEPPRAFFRQEKKGCPQQELSGLDSLAVHSDALLHRPGTWLHLAARQVSTTAVWSARRPAPGRSGFGRSDAAHGIRASVARWLLRRPSHRWTGSRSGTAGLQTRPGDSLRAGSSPRKSADRYSCSSGKTSESSCMRLRWLRSRIRKSLL
jgi:hypothetical protein